MNSISIITPVFNAADTLQDCIDSVQQQTLTTEHIIIDGGSTDATLAIARTYASSGTCTVYSEPDNGMYDGINKGIRRATGTVIGLLNADDMLAGPEVLENISAAFADPGVDSCYSDLVYVSQNNPKRIIRYWKSGPFSHRRFYWGWMPPHPTFYVRRSIIVSFGPYNCSLGSAADYEFMLRLLLKHRISSRYLPMISVKMRTGGVSNASLNNRIKANRMDRRSWKINNLRPYPWTLTIKPLRKVLQWFSSPPNTAAG